MVFLLKKQGDLPSNIVKIGVSRVFLAKKGSKKDLKIVVLTTSVRVLTWMKVTKMLKNFPERSAFFAVLHIGFREHSFARQNP